jgi:DnaJ-class molecular chaperone
MSPTKTLPSRPATRQEVCCAFCHGAGIDPFNVLSDRSVCGACGGRGIQSVPVPDVRCAYCEGTGSFKTFRCPVCEGAGVTSAPEGPTKVCPSCDGLAFERSSGLVCLGCKGRGVVPA